MEALLFMLVAALAFTSPATMTIPVYAIHSDEDEDEDVEESSEDTRLEINGNEHAAMILIVLAAIIIILLVASGVIKGTP